MFSRLYDTYTQQKTGPGFLRVALLGAIDVRCEHEATGSLHASSNNVMLRDETLVIGMAIVAQYDKARPTVRWFLLRLSFAATAVSWAPGSLMGSMAVSFRCVNCVSDSPGDEESAKFANGDAFRPPGAQLTAAFS